MSAKNIRVRVKENPLGGLHARPFTKPESGVALQGAGLTYQCDPAIDKCETLGYHPP